MLGTMEERGVFDILKGQAPKGVEAYAALALLDERGQQGFSGVMLNWSIAWRKWAIQAVEIFREFATEERVYVAMGENGKWAIEKFTGADLTGRVEVISETGVLKPRSQVAKRAIIEQLVQLGAINPTDPETAYTIVREVGMPELLQGMNDDVKEAVRENDQLLDEGMMDRPKFGIDNDMVHMFHHKKFILSDAFKELDPNIQMEGYRHYDEHLMAIMEMQQQAAQTAEAGKAAGKPTDAGQLQNEAQKSSPETQVSGGDISKTTP